MRDNFNQGVTRSEERDLRSPTKMTSLDKIQTQLNVVMMGRGEKEKGVVLMWMEKKVGGKWRQD